MGLDWDEAMLKRLADPAWNPRVSVLLDKSARVLQFSTGKYLPGPDELNLKTYTPTEIEIEAHADQGGYVLINDQYDPDWQVRVNGHDAELLRADYILRAVQVPSGDSTIIMRYRAHYHVAGINPSTEMVNNFSDGAMLAAWLIAGFALRRSRGRQSILQ